MHVDVALLPDQAKQWRTKVCVVVDVLRASSSIVTMFEHGCAAIFVAGSVNEARRLSSQKGHLLAGKLHGLAPSGFDFGNSPAEFIHADLDGRTIVLTTSNGTAALRLVADAPGVLVGCFLNATACCQEALALAARHSADIGIVCAGRERRFALDDASCAGHLVQTMMEIARTAASDMTLTDAAQAAIQLWHAYRDPEMVFRSSASGQRVVEIGRENDLQLCAQIDICHMVPRLAGDPPLRLEIAVSAA